MTVGGYVGYGCIVFFVVIIAFALFGMIDSTAGKISLVIAAAAIIIATYVGLRWYYNETASGQRALIDQRSDFNNGLERTVNIMNDDGEVIRTYTGIIDIEGNDGGYVLFDFDGKRYTYYNCYVESVADIEP